MKDGKGTWKKSQEELTNMYEGEFWQDMKHGQGEFRWQTGGLFRGRYHYDLKHGFGEMIWGDGSVYQGNWVNGI